jgi:hypothetical protein
MKNFYAFCLAAGSVFWSACGSASQPVAADAKQDSVEKSPGDSALNAFFPVADYLRSEIGRVDSTPLAIVQYTTENQKTDSSYIQPAAFDALAREFVVPELLNGGFEKNFSENSFMDKGTQSATFTYSTKDKTLPLQRVDVITGEGNGSNTVRSVYLERAVSAGDSIILKKMYWKARHSFLIITTWRVHGKPPVVRQVKVVWDAGEDPA